MPSISVITPIFADTLAKVMWLEETIESVRKQNFQDWELLIVDDCSSFSLTGLREKLSEDGRLRWFRTTQNSGPALARNTAVGLARGDAILPLDADDLLPDDGALGALYDAWKDDKSRVVYGDLQRLVADGGDGFRRERIVKLAEYQFRLALNLNGLLPVTSMHSKECHEKAGGWKPVFDSGMEDVEYWIAAGKAGFCGKHISRLTLLYRRHEKSRSHQVRHVLRREGVMRELIRRVHQDVFEGRFPMGCCGGGGSRSGVVNPPARSERSQRATTLDQYSSAEKVWVEYQGKRAAAFGMVGKYTGIPYQIHGPGHRLEVQVNDLPLFKRSGRGKDFIVGVAAPPGMEPAVEAEMPKEEPYKAPPPQLAQIERLDRVATQQATQQPTASLNSLSLGNIQGRLEADGWTVEKLARAEVRELTEYKGIGAVRASQIINRAKEALGEPV